MTVEIASDGKDFKILYLSNAPFIPSGYGVQCEGNCYEWNKHYDVRVLSNYGLQGRMLGLNDLLIYPVLTGDDHATRTAELIFKNWKPDLFITLYDIWMGAYVKGMPPAPLTPIHPFWIPIVMVDHEPIPEATVLSAQVAYKVVTPTEFGKRELERNGVETRKIPFGIETDVWRPVADEEEKREAKKFVGARSIPFNLRDSTAIDEDSFLIYVNGANKDPYRKAFSRMFVALQIFLEQNPDAVKDTRMYVNSWMRLARDIPHGAKVLQVDRFCRATTDYHNLCGIPKESMAKIARAADVFFHLSEGGGFEIPILEAITSGVPPIANKFVGMPELVQDHGWQIPLLEAKTGAKGRYFTPLDATQGIADEFKAADALEEAYNSPDKLRRMGERAREFSLRFDWSVVNPMWIELIEEIRAERAYRPLEERKI